MEEALRKLILQARLLARREEKKFQLSEEEILILELLDRNGSLSVSEIYKFFSKKSLSTISMVLTAFWEKKLISKKIVPSNQRVVMIKLLAKGREELSKIREAKVSRYAEILKSLKLSAREEDVLRKVLAGGIDHLDDLLLARK